MNIKTEVQIPEELFKKWDYINAQLKAIREFQSMLVDKLTLTELYRVDVIRETKEYLAAQGLMIEGDEFGFDHVSRKSWLMTKI